jgi:hypothetical protein
MRPFCYFFFPFFKKEKKPSGRLERGEAAMARFPTVGEK